MSKVWMHASKSTELYTGLAEVVRQSFLEDGSWGGCLA